MSRDPIENIEQQLKKIQKITHTVNPKINAEINFQDHLSNADDLNAVAETIYKEWCRLWYKPTRFFYANVIAVLNKFSDKHPKTYSLQKSLLIRADNEKSADVVCYNTMIESCARHKDLEYSREVMSKLRANEAIEFDVRTINAALNVASKCKSAEYAEEQINEAKQQEIPLDKYSMSSLFKLARELCSLELAREYIELANKHNYELDIVCINILIDLAAKNKSPEFVTEILAVADAKELKLNERSIFELLKVAHSISSPERAYNVFKLARNYNIPVDITQITVFLDTIANANQENSVSYARGIYERINDDFRMELGCHTYSALLKVAANALDFEFANELFTGIKRQSFTIDAHIISDLLRVAIHKKSINFAERALEFAGERRVQLDTTCINQMICLAGIVEPVRTDFADEALKRVNWSIKLNKRSFSKLYLLAVRADSKEYASKVKLLEKKAKLNEQTVCSDKVRALAMLGDTEEIKREFAKTKTNITLDHYDYASFCNAAADLDPFDSAFSDAVLTHMLKASPQLNNPLAMALFKLANKAGDCIFSQKALSFLDTETKIEAIEYNFSLISLILNSIALVETKNIWLAKRVMMHANKSEDFQYNEKLIKTLLRIAGKAGDFDYSRELLDICANSSIQVDAITYSALIKRAHEHDNDSFTREVFAKCSDILKEMCPIIKKDDQYEVDLHDANYKTSLLLLENYNLPAFKTVRIVFGRGSRSKGPTSPVQIAVKEYLSTHYNIDLSKDDLNKGSVKLRKNSSDQFVVLKKISVATPGALFPFNVRAPSFVPKGVNNMSP